MNNAVRISEVDMVELRAAARLNSRSIAGQAEHWMRLGRALERDPRTTQQKIESALRGLEPLKLDQISAEEHEEFLDRFDEATREPTKAQLRGAAERRRLGGGVGMDERAI